MFRMRRFRIFLIGALLSILSIYELSRLRSWNVPELEGLTNFGFRHDEVTTANAKPKYPPFTVHSPPTQPDSVNPPPIHDIPGSSTSSTVDESHDNPTSISLEYKAEVTVTGEELLGEKSSVEDEFRQQGEGRFDVKPQPSGKPKAYWKPHAEHFPVEKHVELPEGERRALPSIQYKFESESSRSKADRVRKQTAVREAFKHAWSGYRKHAMGHDELRPVTNTSADTFNGWGATLVDALDTLWIMGLTDEFDEAVKQVAKIDFKTSPRKDIPLFETTIRYLGGLIAAYDISGGTHVVLLDKAVELADILMGAFDTPNRMPVPYYHWAPSYTSQPHRASTHIVMAELGSLAVEFTRLSQLTKEARYYDAVARVTDALQEWQMKTTYPGVWPVRLDASGCKKPKLAGIHDPSGLLSNDDGDFEIADDNIQPEEGLAKRELDDESDPHAEDIDSNEGGVDTTVTAEEFEFEDEDLEDVSKADCEQQGLAAEPHAKTHTYSIAAMADSTYEYFPKQHALLGGLSDQYKSMYIDSMETIRSDFLFRPMIKEKRDLLFLTKYDISPRARKKSERKKAIYEATHLGCFAGAMFALGSKMFDIPSDMPLAEQLTDACVWGYESTPLGVMAEEFLLVPCESKSSCAWNETRWREWLDPHQYERFEAVELYNKQQEVLQRSVLSDGFDDTAPSNLGPDSKRKRQELEDEADEEDAAVAPSRTLHTDTYADPSLSIDPLYIPKVALSHEKYVDARISEERLPPGYTQFHSREYKLRPEAIESVFVMYRLTGDEKWRDKGWTMFQAVEAATRTASGHASIKDVTSQLGELRDTMESFWLAETLKYYYLLFSEESLVSLDDWVLNTEAHPFKLQS